MRLEHIQKMQEQAKQSFGSAAKELGDYREPWRIFRIMAELVEGYQFLTQFESEVTIFGSARLKSSDPHYHVAEQLGKLLAKNGFTVITGGGPGIMEAANKGAAEAGGQSVGLNIQLPFEQVVNPYVQKCASFNYFFTRKVMLTSPANAFVFFPGGFGTMDEFFEVVDLMELGMMPRSPVVLVGKDFWQPLIDFLRASCVVIGSVENDMIASWHVVDTAEEAFVFLKDVHQEMPVCDISPNSFHCEGNIDWKLFRIMAELVEGLEFITGIVGGVTVLGTKSIEAANPYYMAAYDAGAAFAQKGYPVITGGKKGIAEAANKGAFEHGGLSVGIGMRVGQKTDMNPYLNKSILFSFPFTRKLIVTSPTKAFLIFPGGLGTMHQLFEILTLIQTKKMEKIPILLLDHSFWKPLHAYVKKIFVHNFETIESEDDELYQIVDHETNLVRVLEDYEVIT